MEIFDDAEINASLASSDIAVEQIIQGTILQGYQVNPLFLRLKTLGIQVYI